MFLDTCNQSSFWESHSEIIQQAASASQTGLLLDCLSIEKFDSQTERWSVFSLDYTILSFVSIFREAGSFICWDSCIAIFYINRLGSKTVLTPSVVPLASPQLELHGKIMHLKEFPSSVLETQVELQVESYQFYNLVGERITTDDIYVTAWPGGLVQQQVFIVWCIMYSGWTQTLTSHFFSGTLIMGDMPE